MALHNKIALVLSLININSKLSIADNVITLLVPLVVKISHIVLALPSAPRSNTSVTVEDGKLSAKTNSFNPIVGGIIKVIAMAIVESGVKKIHITMAICESDLNHAVSGENRSLVTMANEHKSLFTP